MGNWVSIYSFTRTNAPNDIQLDSIRKYSVYLAFDKIWGNI